MRTFTAYMEPGFALTPRQARRMTNALREVETAISTANLGNGLRIFDAYITTRPPGDTYTGDAYLIRDNDPQTSTRPPMPPHQPRRRWRAWWRRNK